MMTQRGMAGIAGLLVLLAGVPALAQSPFRGGWLGRTDPRREEVEMDLNTVRAALALHDAREAFPLLGTDLAPLLDVYMRELPRMPDGSLPYFDGAAGVLAYFGADERAGGDDPADQDRVVYTRPALTPVRAQYQGSWGRPRPGPKEEFSRGNKVVVTLSKPAIVQEPTWPRDLVLLQNVYAGMRGTPSPDGAPLPFAGPEADRGWGEVDTWRSAGDAWYGPHRDPLHQPEFGVLVIRCAEDRYEVGAPAVTPTMAIDLAATAPTSGLLRETWAAEATPPSPLDPEVFGPGVEAYRRAPAQVERVDGQRRGVRLEKY